MLVLLVFIISIVITTIYSVTKVEKTDEEITISTTDFQAEIVDNEIIVNEEQTVTGINGENDTLIPATVEKVVDAKVLQVSVNNSSIEVSMIGISIPNEKKQLVI